MSDSNTTKAKATDKAPAGTHEEHRAALEADWSLWEATERIYHDGVLAYDAGHAVPHSNVELYGYDKMDPPKVRRVE